MSLSESLVVEIEPRSIRRPRMILGVVLGFTPRAHDDDGGGVTSNPNVFAPGLASFWDCVVAPRTVAHGLTIFVLRAEVFVGAVGLTI